MNEFENPNRSPHIHDGGRSVDNRKQRFLSGNKIYSGLHSRSQDALYDQPIPKPTTDLGFHGISHKRTYDSLTSLSYRRSKKRAKPVHSY
jgi:hypothetical protein